MPSASVKVMLSYDYCHFEVCLSSDKDMSIDQVNELRKDAQRLADEAVRQYKVAKEMAQKRIRIIGEKADMEKEVEAYKDVQESEWPEKIKAINKTLQDEKYWDKYNYDYRDEDEEQF